MTGTLQEKEAALAQHIRSSSDTSAAVQAQLEEAKAAQQALKEQVEKLETSQVPVPFPQHPSRPAHHPCLSCMCPMPAAFVKLAVQVVQLIPDS